MCVCVREREGGGKQRKMKKYSSKKKKKERKGERKTHRLFIPLTSIPRMAKEPSH